MLYYIGLDVGSIATKAVVVNDQKELCASRVIKTGAHMRQALEQVRDGVLSDLKLPFGREAFAGIVSTGYGRKNVADADTVITEITAHAHGARFLYPATRQIIDIGGQDMKVISLGPDGEIDDFVMNDKCSAGTGRFLEVMAGILDIPLNEFGEYALSYSKRLSIGSTCTVFAESEVISLISRQEKKQDIAFAIHNAIVDRIISLARKIHPHGAVTLSGGVSRNAAICSILRERLQTDIFLPSDPQLLGALGAALHGLNQ